MEQINLDISLKQSNALKGIALTLLLIHHLFYINNGMFDDYTIAGYPIVNTLGVVCKVCVAIFVFLSGYALGKTNAVVSISHIKSFYLRRFTKLFLNYWLIWVLFVPIGVFIFHRYLKDVYADPVWLYGILDFIGLINVTGHLGYNPTWWFYSCIILLYLIFPIIAISISRWPKSKWVFLFLSVFIFFIPCSILNPIKPYLFPFTLGFIMSNTLFINTLPPPFVKSLFSGTLNTAGVILLTLLFITSVILRLSIPYALLWDTCITIIHVSYKHLTLPTNSLV
ncbi:MAG: acyltransferase, partial [Muribaculaceae bacterium]|nr:acyltransferase [Muribaculaceae bacterium]